MQSSMVKQEFAIGPDSSTLTVEEIHYSWKRCDFKALKSELSSGIQELESYKSEFESFNFNQTVDFDFQINFANKNKIYMLFWLKT
jgi:hypothetical protein